MIRWRSGRWTHPPTVETVSGLRVIPNLDIIRPADPEETAGAFVRYKEQTALQDSFLPVRMYQI